MHLFMQCTVRTRIALQDHCTIPGIFVLGAECVGGLYPFLGTLVVVAVVSHGKVYHVGGDARVALALEGGLGLGEEGAEKVERRRAGIDVGGGGGE